MLQLSKEKLCWFCPPSVIHSIYFEEKEKLCHNILVNGDDVNVPWTVSMFPSIACKNQLKIIANRNNQPRLHFETVRQRKKAIVTLIWRTFSDATRPTPSNPWKLRE